MADDRDRLIRFTEDDKRFYTETLRRRKEEYCRLIENPEEHKKGAIRRKIDKYDRSRFLSSIDLFPLSQDLFVYLQIIIFAQIRWKYFDNISWLIDLGADFWEVVVITAIDEVQKEYYEHQIEQKKRKKEIPRHVRYLVIPDPPGAKIGCGGSTLYVLDVLEKEFGSELMDQCLQNLNMIF